MGKGNWSLIVALTGASLFIQLCFIIIIGIEPRGSYSNEFHLMELILIGLAAIAACLATAFFIIHMSKMSIRYRESYVLAAVMIIYCALSILFFFILPGTWGFSA